MPRRTKPSYQKLVDLSDERKLDRSEALFNVKASTEFMDTTGEIPGTVPEKIIYNYLVKLRINFEFQYHMPENLVTANPESDWVPDFLLPDYNDSLIEVYGTYWHTLKRESDQIKKAYWLVMGYAVVEKGITTYPSTGYTNGGKVVIWWDHEIYYGLDQLVSRDFPELLEHRNIGQPAPYVLDAEKEFLKLETMRARLKISRVKPKIHPAKTRIKKLRKRYGS